VPYWFVDGGMAVMALLLAAEDAGLGALFFGLFEQEALVVEAFGVPPEWRPLGVVALGHPAPSEEQRPSRSVGRSRPDLSEVVDRGHWSDPAESHRS
jgi:nitroreductase